jgi:hypothetical protein
MIDRLAAIEESAEVVAKEMALELEKDLKAQIARGEAPDGAKWPKRQDGEAPLQGAAKALTVEAHGPVVVAQLSGATALHHLGMGKGGVRRQILPNGVPKALVRVAERVAARLISTGR